MKYYKHLNRQSNFELLRIICMLMIICGHIIMVHGYKTVGDSSWYIDQIFRPFCSVAVNVFILISGYFGIKLNIKILLSLNWMVTFYCILFLILSVYLGIHAISIYKDWMQLLPIITKQYWFLTDYFALCFISPFLNKLVDVLDKESFKKLLITCFALFCIHPTLAVVLNFQTITLDSGYGLINFMFLYLLGRYIKLHNTYEWSKYNYLAAYLGCMSVMTAFQLCYSKLLGFDFDALISYDTFFTFVGALCLFMFFRGLSFSNKFVNQLAKSCLAVYVIHLNPLTFHYLFENILQTKTYVGWNYVIFLFIVPLIIYISCTILELMRMKFFYLLSKNKP